MFKKFKKTGKIFLRVILAGLVVFEFYYYGIIDFRESRNLTSGEIKFLSEVYGSKINYSKVKIYSGKFWFYPIQDENVAMAPNGNVYFSEKYFKKDFSKSTVWDEAWLIHEMMHIQQYEEQGQIFAWKTVLLQLNYIIFNNSPYNYEIDFFKKLKDYNLEQQGDIAQDYFLFLRGERIFSKQEALWYANILDI